MFRSKGCPSEYEEAMRAVRSAMDMLDSTRNEFKRRLAELDRIPAAVSGLSDFDIEGLDVFAIDRFDNSRTRIQYTRRGEKGNEHELHVFLLTDDTQHAAFVARFEKKREQLEAERQAGVERK